MKEEELAATGRAVNALLNVPIGIRDHAFSEVLLKVHALLDPLGAHDAAKAYMLITDVTRSFPGTDQKSWKNPRSRDFQNEIKRILGVWDSMIGLCKSSPK